MRADVPHFGGDQVGAPTDNELDAPMVVAVLHVAETRSRVIGVGQDTATITLRTVAGGLVPNIPAEVDSVTLTPARTAVAGLAAGAEDVRSTLSAIEGATDLVADLGLEAVAIAVAVDAWNRHLTRDAGADLHGEPDMVAVEPAAPVSAAQAMATLNALRTAFNAHCLLDLPTHGAASVVHLISADVTPDATDFATALALWTALRDRLGEHMADPSQHPGKADGAAWEWLEPPRTALALAHKTAALRSVFITHARRTGYDATHAAVDTGNVVPLAFDNLGQLILTVNAWADSIERHTANRGPDSAVVGSPFHTYPTPKKIPLRASDLATCKRVAELCWLAYEAHALEWADIPVGPVPPSLEQQRPHGGPTWGLYGPGPMRDRLALRLVRAWQVATRGLVTPTTAGANSAGAALVALEGWALSLRRFSPVL